MESLFDERHKRKQVLLHFSACHVHALVNADRLSVVAECNAAELRTDIRFWLRSFRIDFKRRGSSARDERERPPVELFVAQCTNIQTVVPLKFFVVEYSRRLVKMLHLEILCQLFKCINVLALFIRTAEQRNIINNCTGQISSRTEFIQARRTVAL